MGDAVKSLILSSSDTANKDNAPFVQIALGVTHEFTMVNVARQLVRGDWSLYYKLSGGGTIDFEYFLSWDNTAVVAPVSTDTIRAGVTSPSEAAIGFIPVLAPWLGIRAVEQGVGAVDFEELILTFH